jgi:Na+-transporting methylmalonyl-CoA/oxaloacetate decarboxylase gamma subunit
MSLATSLLVAVFCLAVVFLVLAIIYFLIRIFSAVVGGIKSSPREPAAAPNSEPRLQSVPTILADISASEPNAAVKPEPKQFSAGIIKLNDVDEKSAAMVMAVVSHETGIPLSQLRFKSIRRIDE